jgi:predicted Zn finger-like uncharacterized protein
MKLNCEKCNAVYNIDESKLPPSGLKVHCKKCSNLLVIGCKKEGNDGVPKAQQKPKTTSIKEKEDNKQKYGLKSDNLFSFFLKNRKKEQDRAFEESSNSKNKRSMMKTHFSSATSSFNRSKIAVCASIFLIILLIQFQTTRNLLFENQILKFADSNAEEMIDDNIKRATVAFTIARAMNAVISIIQESELQIEPAGLGVTIAVGEIFDPVNDLIERFSWVMLLSLISLGIMKTLIHISSWLSIDVFLSFGLFFILLAMFFNEKKRKILLSVGKKALIGALIVRFAVPVAMHLNQKVYSSVLSAEYESATRTLEHSNQKLSEINQNMDESINGQENSGWFDKFKNVKESMAKIIDLKSKITAVKKVASDLAETLIKLCVVFLLNTVLLPIGFLWLFTKVIRMLFGSQFAIGIEEKVKAKIYKNRKVQTTPAVAI